MTERLPTVGGDSGTWGTVLNGYLGVSHNADGSHKHVFNVKDYGCVGNGSTDDTTNFQAALTAAGAAGGGIVFVPVGTYILDEVEVSANTVLHGTGWGSILKQKLVAGDNHFMVNVNRGSGGTTAVSGNVSGVVFRDLQFLGTVATDAFQQHVHLLVLSACSDTVVDRCLFKGFRGDGIYLGSTGGVERHNERITIVNCTFDGVNQDNRNCISIIDGTDIVIAHNHFRNSTRTDMPGAIDFEPNPTVTYQRNRHNVVFGNTFEAIRGTAGCVSIVLQNEATYTTRSRGFLIANNIVRDCGSGTSAFFLRQLSDAADAGVPMSCTISNNVTYDTGAPVEMAGVRGVQVLGNTFEKSWVGVNIGYDWRCKDIHFSGNRFDKVGDAGGVMNIIKVDRLVMRDNIYDDCGAQAGGDGRICNFTIGSGSVGSSTRIDFLQNQIIGTKATVLTAKNASHTLTASGNSCWGNFLNGLTLDANHFAGQARLTYSRATETGQDAAMRTALSGQYAQLLQDSTTA